MYLPSGNRSASRSVPSSANPRRSGTARLRAFSVPALITTRCRSQGPNAWSISARTASVIVPRPWAARAQPVADLTRLVQPAHRRVADAAHDPVVLHDRGVEAAVGGEPLQALPDELPRALHRRVGRPRHPLGQHLPVGG